jgi:hypothetical protein
VAENIMNFKNFLQESMITSTLLAKFDVTKLSLDDLVQCYKNAGYEVSVKEHRLFIESKYAGFSSGSGHSYWVVMEKDDNDGFYISRWFIEITADGRLAAEPSGNPVAEAETEEEIDDKFRALKVKT